MKFRVSSTPHVRARSSVDDIMLDVIIALMPATFAGVILFGQRALLVMLTSVLSCVGFELLYQIIAHKKRTVRDFSAVVTGMLLGLVMPSTVPLYAVIVAAFISIVVTKQLFGGLGHNFMNPALVGRAFVLASFPTVMTAFTSQRIDFFQKVTADVYTGATPLAANYVGNITMQEHFFGRLENGSAIPGCIGETCVLALLLGFAYLLVRRVISARIPLAYIGSVILMTWAFGSNAAANAQDPLLSVMTGGVLLGAIFMATDYVTTPTTGWGQIIFGIGCGVVTCIIRFWGGYPEGVTYAILLMNVLTPLIDRWTMPKPFGKVKE